MKKKIFKISGMHCASCAKLIKMELEDFVGVSLANVDLNSAKGYFEFNSGEISPSQIKNKIESLGYIASEE